MFSLTVLASSSSGNCALVEAGGTRLLIDAGLSAKQIRERLAAAGTDITQIDGILVTHEHYDHVCGLEVLCKKTPLPVFCNRPTQAAIKSETAHNWRLFQTGAEFTIGDITVQTVPIPHDAMEPVAFVLHHGNDSLGFVTDLGHATKLVYERVRRVHTLVIEANHDEKLLQNDTRRPWPVKQRIMSRHGHLSNNAAAGVVGEMLEHSLRRVVLGHLSRDCNTPELALASMQALLAQRGAAHVELHCAAPGVPGPRFAIGA
jgi:phosphoribosyl 1,2-cyclic phosphodiesterase